MNDVKVEAGLFLSRVGRAHLFLVVQSSRLTLTHALGANFGIKPFVIQDFFFEVANREFFCFQVSFCPAKRGNRASSSRNETTLGEVFRPVSRSPIVAVAIISACSFFNYLAR